MRDGYTGPVRAVGGSSRATHRPLTHPWWRSASDV